MDIKIKNGVLSSPEFAPAFQKIVVGVQMTARQCLEVSTILEEVHKQARIVDRTRQMIIEKYSSKNEAGKVITNEKGDAQFSSNEDKNSCIGELNQLMDEDFTLQISKKIEIPEDFKMIPQEFMLLSDLLDLVDDKK